MVVALRQQLAYYCAMACGREEVSAKEEAAQFDLKSPACNVLHALTDPRETKGWTSKRKGGTQKYTVTGMHDNY